MLLLSVLMSWLGDLFCYDESGFEGGECLEEQLLSILYIVLLPYL